MKTVQQVFDELVSALAKEIERRYGDRLVSLVVFGSVGRGRARPDSDLDLLIVARDLPKGRLARVEEFKAVERAMEQALENAERAGVTTRLSPIFKTPEEALRGSPLFLDMTEDARLVVDRDRFFESVLERLRRRLAELGSKRVWKGTRWYWVLKPGFQPGDVVEL